MSHPVVVIARRSSPVQPELASPPGIGRRHQPAHNPRLEVARMPKFSRFRNFAVALVAAQAVAVLAAGQALGAKSASGLLLGESSPVLSNPNQQAIAHGEDLAASQYGWSVKHLDANLSPSKQVSDVDTFINLKVKGLITWTLDPGTVAAAYKRALVSNVPIIDFGSTSNVSATVYDQRGWGCGMGLRAAQYISSRIPKAKVLVVGGPPVPSITNYTNCFVQAAKSLGMTVLAEQKNVNDTAATAQPIVQSMLTKYPNAQAIWCYNDPSALGAGAVVRSSGKTVWSGSKKGIIIEGANGSADAAAGIKQGVITATWDPQPTVMGSIAVELLAMSLKDHKPLSSLPKVIVVPMKVWDTSNISGYVDPLKRPVTLGAIPASWIAKK
jgi:ribose transport system substrate-binding protein